MTGAARAYVNLAWILVVMLIDFLGFACQCRKICLGDARRLRGGRCLPGPVPAAGPAICLEDRLAAAGVACRRVGWCGGLNLPFCTTAANPAFLGNRCLARCWPACPWPDVISNGARLLLPGNAWPASVAPLVVCVCGTGVNDA